MNSDIRETLSDAEGRYLEPEEQTMLMEYADSLEQRLIIMRDVQATESEIVDSVVETVMEQHPEAVERHQKLRDKTARDVSMVLRYCVLAMVKDDPEYLEDQVLHWFRKVVVEAFEMDEYIDTAYSTLIDEVDRHLEADDFQILAPYLRMTHSILIGE